MEYLSLITTISLIHLIWVISPWPDLIIAIKNSITYWKKTWIWTALGFWLWISVHIFYCMAGLALLISQSIILFNIIKLLWAIYLIYIWYKSFSSKSSNIELKNIEKKENISAFQAVKIGFLTNVLNPKVSIFFLSIFSLIISPETPNSILIILWIILVLQVILWFSIVAIFFSQKKVQKIFNKFQWIFNKIFWWLLIWLGIKIAFTER